MNSWLTKKLGEICDIYQPKTISKKEMIEGGKYSVYGANGIIGAYDKFNHEDSELLITCRGATCGSVNVSVPKSWINGNAMVVRSKDENILSKEFLRYFFISIDLSSVITGSAQPQITRQTLSPFEIPLPPLPEQQRIVKILDEAFEKIAKAKENTEKNLQNSKDLFESYLRGVFAKPGEDWEEKRLGDICDFVRGPFGGSLKKSILKKNGYAVYEQRHAIYDQFTRVRYFIDENKFNEMKRFELKPGDLIMSCSGTMGKIAIAPEGIKKGVINQALLKLSPKKDLLNEFLKDWMDSGVFQDDLKKYTKGAAIKNVVSVKILKGIKIFVPKMQEQKSIVAKLDALSAETKKLEENYKKKLADLEELKKSILKKAFAREM
ncbi:MAG: restriction endonuclease subunit S [Patescibacteria group bacterium]|jgi:type I restriction enzyme S subunit